MKYCKTCIHWKNEQSELAYSSGEGFCTGKHLKYNTQDGVLVSVLDRQNRHENHYDGTQYVESIETYLKPNRSRYLLVTSEDFGCNQHVDKKGK